MIKRVILPAGFLSALIIGAGMFALPYVFYLSGPITGIFYLVIFALVFVTLHLMYADIIVRTEERHRFVGYAERYLGRAGMFISIGTTLVGYILISTIYLIISASFFKLLFPIPDLAGVLIFWTISAVFVFLRIRGLTWGEFLIGLMIFTIAGLVFFYGFFNGGTAISYGHVHPLFFLLPFGPVLFSLSGRSGISLLVEYFGSNRFSFKLLWRPILIGTVFPILVYIIFSAGILRISPIPTQDSVTGLLSNVPVPLIWAIAILGLASIGSSYTIIAREIEGIFASDFRIPAKGSIAIAVALPLILYLLGFQNFLALIALAGGVFLAAENILVISMWKVVRKIKSPHALIKRIHPVILYSMITIFIGGILYEVIIFTR